jgi:hypothetical protein
VSLRAVVAALDRGTVATRADRIRAAADQAQDVLRGFNREVQCGPDADIDQNVRDFAALMRLKAEELEREL